MINQQRTTAYSREKPRAAVAPPSYDRAQRGGERARRSETFAEPGPIDLRAPPSTLAASLSSWRPADAAVYPSGSRPYDRWSDTADNDRGVARYAPRLPATRSIGRLALSGVAAMAVVAAAVGIVFLWTSPRTSQESAQVAVTAPATTETILPASDAAEAPAAPAPVQVAPAEPVEVSAAAPAPATTSVAPAAAAPDAASQDVPESADPRWASSQTVAAAAPAQESAQPSAAEPLAYAETGNAGPLASGIPAPDGTPVPTPRPVGADSSAPASDTVAPPEVRVEEAPPAEEPQAARAEPKEPAEPAASAARGQMRKVARSVTLRSAPSNGGAALGTISSGETVNVISCNFWCEVIHEGKRGFVFRSFLSGGGSAAAVDRSIQTASNRKQAQKPAAARPTKAVDEFSPPQKSP